MSHSTSAAPKVVENRTGTPAPPPPMRRASGVARPPGLRARVFAQLTRMLAQLALR